MDYEDVPSLLREIYEEAIGEIDTCESERYRLALIGLTHAFIADCERKGINLQDAKSRSQSKRVQVNQQA